MSADVDLHTCPQTSYEPPIHSQRWFVVRGAYSTYGTNVKVSGDTTFDIVVVKR